MKKIFVVILLIMATNCYASQNAITDKGESVTLNDDGTWVYAKKEKSITIGINDNKFVKPEDSTFLVKSLKNNSAYWINTNTWSYKKSTSVGATEYKFYLKDKDLYGMAITEEIQIPVESLAEIAFTNAQSMASDAKVTKKEFRNVNGKKVIYMEMTATLQGIPFTYLGYYFSDASGSTQLVTYTATSVVSKYRSEAYNLLNGLVFQ